MSRFIRSYAGKKGVFTDALLDELIEPYSRVENLHAAFGGYHASHSESIKQNEALLSDKKPTTVPSMSISGGKGGGDVLPGQMAARFVRDKSKFKAVILPECGHWLMEECGTEVMAHLAEFINR